MSIENELNRIISAKEAIEESISAKGITVPANSMLDDMAGLIDLIGASAVLQTGNAICGDQSCPVIYFKSGKSALVFFSAKPYVTGYGRKRFNASVRAVGFYWRRGRGRVFWSTATRKRLSIFSRTQ